MTYNKRGVGWYETLDGRLIYGQPTAVKGPHNPALLFMGYFYAQFSERVK